MPRQSEGTRGSGSADDHAFFGQCGNLRWGKPGLPEDLGVVLAQARRLAAQARALARRPEFDGDGRQADLLAFGAAGARDEDVEQPAAWPADARP